MRGSLLSSILSSVLASLALGLASCRGSTVVQSAPSIVLVVVDTLRADRTTRTFGDGQLMPAFARAAADGWSFEHAVSAAPLTMPSVAALMTGLYPDRAGVISHDRRTHLDCASPTLAELARKAGYQTAAVVSNPWLASRATRFDRGFDIYKTRRSEKLATRRLDATKVTDLAIDVLEATPRPLLLWVHYIDPHMPYQPPAEDAAAVGNASATSKVIREFVDEAVDPQEVYFAPRYDVAEIENTRRLYDAAARYVDREIARLLAQVDRAFGKDGVIVILTADHGESLGEHGLWFAHDFTLYEELTHVPLVVRVPGERAARVSTPVSLVDVLPMLCAHTPLECPADLDGKALAPAIEDRGPVFSAGAPYRERYAKNPFIRVKGIEGRWASIRHGDSKLIRIPRPGGIGWERYDLAADPAEMSTVFDASQDRQRVAQLEAWMVAQHQARNTRLATAKPPRPQGRGRPKLGRDTRAELRALGYLH